MMYSKIILIICITTFSGSFGALFLKKGMDNIQKFQLSTVLRSPWIILGVSSYIISAITNIMLLQLVPVSVGFPLTSLSYVWTVFISYFTLKEKITKNKLLGICLIIIGVMFISN